MTTEREADPLSRIPCPNSMSRPSESFIRVINSLDSISPQTNLSQTCSSANLSRRLLGCTARMDKTQSWDTVLGQHANLQPFTWYYARRWATLSPFITGIEYVFFCLDQGIEYVVTWKTCTYIWPCVLPNMGNLHIHANILEIFNASILLPMSTT